MNKLEYHNIIESSIKMVEPNASILIHEGDFTIKNKSQELIIKGSISYEWFPSNGVRFKGSTQNSTSKLLLNDFDEKSELFINGFSVGCGTITNINIENFDKNAFIQGRADNPIIFGDKTASVEKIIFSIPNFRQIFGKSVRKEEHGQPSFPMSRLELENKKYIIKIDKCYNYEDIQSSLKAKGGYIIQYYGEIICKKGVIKYNDIQELFYCFNKFISFINGRRSSALFMQGIHNNVVLWEDYTGYIVDLYKYVQSWLPKHSIDGINELWQVFSERWQNQDDKNFLSSVIHWYVEVNNQSGFVIGSIIMAQTALELIYNWLVIEKKGILTGKDAENITAANKIRLLLSQLNINYNIPISFTNLQSYCNKNREIKDAPDTIVQIRNSIVHSQIEKRKKLALIDNMAMYEALQLCIWYIEMAILYILDFNGVYYNRCSGATYSGQGEEIVPWMKK